MGTVAHDKDLSRLRVVTQRISITPTRQLPHVVRNLACLIAQSGSQLFSSDHDGSKRGSDHSILVHKFKTQVSTLLQDRSPQARFAAAVLVKTSVEAGDLEFLKHSGRWVGSLISILGKPDPLASKKISVLALTRIFILSHADQQIVREITTPALPGFVTACFKLLANAEDAGLSILIIQAFLELLPRHPTSFRPFVPQLQSFLLPYIAPTPSNLIPEPEGGNAFPAGSEPLLHVCRALYIRLTSCAPKDKSGDEWTKLLNAAVEDLHLTCDRVFRAIWEDWSGTDCLRSHARNYDPGDLAQTSHGTAKSLLKLPNWRGIEAGLERLSGLLELTQCFLISPTPSSIILPLGAVLDVSSRIFNIAALDNRENPAIERHERELVRLALPVIYASALDLCTVLIRRLGHGSAGFIITTIELAVAAPATFWSSNVWKKSYAMVLRAVFVLFGSCFPPWLASPISRDLARFCNQISHHDQPDEEGLGLIRAALLHLPSAYLNSFARTSLEKTAILTGDKEALLACTLNPATRPKARRQNPSLLPFLAREHPDAPETEALIRPRMAPLSSKVGSFSSELEPVGNGFWIDEKDADHDRQSPMDTSNGVSNMEGSLQYTQPPHISAHTEIPESLSFSASSPPTKRSYAEPQGAYTIYHPSADTPAIDDPSDIEDEPAPSAKKPRLEDQATSQSSTINNNNHITPPPTTSVLEVKDTFAESNSLPPSTDVVDDTVQPMEMVEEVKKMKAAEGKVDGGRQVGEIRDGGDESEDSPTPTIYTSSDEEEEEREGENGAGFERFEIEGDG